MWQPPTIAPGTTVYHYTRTDGLVGALTGRTLWASSAASLNDLSEIARGRKKVRRRLRAELAANPADPAIELALDVTRRGALYAHDRAEVFVLCASRERDDAAQWRLYTGPRSGFALHIDTDVRLQVVGPPADAPPEAGTFGEALNTTMVEHWHPVAYTPRERRPMLDSLVDWIRKRYATGSAAIAGASASGPQMNGQAALITMSAEIASAAQLAAALIKPRGFRAENEVRAVIRLVVGEGLIEYRATSDLPVGYVRLASDPHPSAPLSTAMPDGKDPQTGQPLRTLPVTGITVGPTMWFDDIERTVRSLATKGGLGPIPIERSRVPLRW